jgi:hypothetical protein
LCAAGRGLYGSTPVHGTSANCLRRVVSSLGLWHLSFAAIPIHVAG